MKTTFVLALTLSIVAISYAQNVPGVRFVNAMENTTLDIYTNTFKTITLNFTDVSGYQAVPAGSIQVTNIVNHETGESYTGANPQLIGFLFNATVCIYQINGTVVLVRFNETAPSTIEDSESWVRLIDLATASDEITLAYTDGAVAAYVGPMVNTMYYNIDPTTTSMRIYLSATGSYNSPMITLNTDFNASCAYTVFYFTPSTGPIATFNYDRSFLGWSNGVSSSTSSSTGVQSTSSSSSSSSTTGVVPSSSTSSSTLQSTTTSTSGVVVVQESSAASTIVGLTAVIGLALAF